MGRTSQKTTMYIVYAHIDNKQVTEDKETYLHEMIHPCEELGVDGKPAVEHVMRLC